MKKVHIFNPENDINLAYGHDTPRLSPMVRALAHDGQTLPLWYASSGDYVIMSDYNKKWLDNIYSDFGIEAQPFVMESGLMPTPWGWSVQIARSFRDMNLPTPTDSQLDTIRNLSHRRASIFLANRLNVEPPVEATTTDTIQDFIDTHGDAFIKAPWSSSGRGVFRAKDLHDSDISQIKSIIKRQGCVMLERAFDRRQDFAMLFEASEGKVNMRGYSLFMTADNGGYTGNLIGTDDDILLQLEKLGADIRKLKDIEASVENALTDYIAGAYTGWLGVDMMLCHDGTIVPCIELNLRMTMGIVAKLFGEKWLVPGATALYRVTPRSMPSVHKYKAEKHRLVQGCLPLNSPSDKSGFDFTVTVNSDKDLQFPI